jgi:hypothetical protein
MWGDDEGDDGAAQTATTTETVSKAEFIEQGDDLCGQFREEVEGLDEELTAALEDGDYEEAATILSGGLEITRRQLEEFEALPTPEADAAVIDDYLSSTEQQLAITDRLVEALRDQDVSQISALAEEVDEIETETDGIAKGYGFKVCGQQD